MPAPRSGGRLPLNAPTKTLTKHGEDRAKWKQGFKTGRRQREDEMLRILQHYSVIWWDESQRCWLNMTTGKPIYGLDWREENEGSNE
jgi:hypothetical protein